MVVSEVLGQQGGKVTISSLKEQSDSLLIHSATIDKCHWWCACYRNRAMEYKETQEKPMFLEIFFI